MNNAKGSEWPTKISNRNYMKSTISDLSHTLLVLLPSVTVLTLFIVLI